MTRIPNPYIVGTPIPDPAFFYGRSSLISFVRDTLNPPQQRVIVLYGQRRIGKTSVLYELARRLDDDYYPVYFDLMGQANRPLILALSEIAHHIADILDIPPPPHFNTPFDFRAFLENACNELPLDQHLLLLLDEFDDLSDQEVQDDAAALTLFDYLRNLLNIELPIVFIFVVGRRLTELPHNFQSILKQAPSRRVGFLDEAETRQLIIRSAEGILEYSPTAVQAIYDLTSGHPYFVQLICSELFRLGINREKNKIEARDVTAVLDSAMETGKGGLAWFWDGLPLAERFVMSAIAETSGAHNAATTEAVRKLLASYNLRFLGLEITDAPNLLVQWEILKQTPDGYQFTVDLVRRWILAEHPMAQARREVENISTRANRYFANAREAHQSGEITLAIADYRRALDANPNLVRAQLGLAHALEEKGDWLAAHQAYQKAYELDHPSARDGLCNSYDKLAALDEQNGNLTEAILRLEHAQEIMETPTRTTRINEFKARIAAQHEKLATQEERRGRLEEAIAQLEKAQEVIETPSRSMRIQGIRTRMTAEQERRTRQWRQLRLLVVGGGLFLLVGVLLITAVNTLTPFLLEALFPTPTAPSVIPTASPGETLILVAPFEDLDGLGVDVASQLVAIWSQTFPDIRFEQVETPVTRQGTAFDEATITSANAVIWGSYQQDFIKAQITFVNQVSSVTQTFYFTPGVDTGTYAGEALAQFQSLGMEELAHTLSGRRQDIPLGYLFGRLRLQTLVDAIPEVAPFITGTIESADADIRQAIAEGFFEPVILQDAYGHSIAFVPSGEFSMGRAYTETTSLCEAYGANCQDAGNSDWVHTVWVKPFFISVYEVSNGAYKQCVQAEVCAVPQQFNSLTRSGYYDSGDYDEKPVIFVNWSQAEAYCMWLGGRLPTEAEWEKAARWDPITQTSRTYPWGDETPNSTLANFETSPGDTEAVTDYPEGRSPMGVYNMAGNVYEWVFDSFDAAYYRDSPAENPTGPGDTGQKVLRGGSFGTEATGVPAVDPAYRFGHDPSNASDVIGIRCAFDVPVSSSE